MCGQPVPDPDPAQVEQKHRARTRGNKQGSVYKRGNVWQAAVTVKSSRNGSRWEQKRIYKGGFPTKKAALSWIATVHTSGISSTPCYFAEAYKKWYEAHKNQVKSMGRHDAAYKYLAPIHGKKVDSILPADIQECINACTKKISTRSNIKKLAIYVFDWCIDNNMILKNPASKTEVGPYDETKRAPITMDQVRTIYNSKLEYSEYVIALCFLGFRPSELFALRKTDVHYKGSICYLVQGSKTEAGRDRAVTVPPDIVPILTQQMALDSDFLFPRKITNEDGTVSYVQMTEKHFREYIFKPMIKQLGISGILPYGARHTYSNLLGDSAGADKDKAALIGHAKYSTTVKLYQSSDLEHMQAITDQMSLNE